ncbi:MAG: hypothetical protein HGA49_00610 [Eubacteriaceae bacterium]|nr:hypothetical protein [Eubacteriaceae bacterium]
MINEQLKSMIEDKIDKANYNNKGFASVALEGIENAETVDAILADLGDKYNEYKFEYSVETGTLKIVNPGEDIESFERRHPSPRQCGN